MSEIIQYIQELSEKKNLSRIESGRVFQIISHGGATPAQIAAILMGLSQKGETVEEITGAAEAWQARCGKVNAPIGTIDICGIGNNSLNILNISTAAGLVIAGCGVPIAKHHNRITSCTTCSAEILHELGVNVEPDLSLVERSLIENNFCFMITAKFHQAMRNILPICSEIRIKTMLNITSALCNPAFVKRIVLGVSNYEHLKPMAEVLRNLGFIKAWVVYGSCGIDELTLSGVSHVAELKNGEISLFELEPLDYKMDKIEQSEIYGGSTIYNTKKLTNLLSSVKDGYYNTVVINAAAGLIVADKAKDLKEGIELAKESIDSGRAKSVLKKLVEITNLNIKGE